MRYAPGTACAQGQKAIPLAAIERASQDVLQKTHDFGLLASERLERIPCAPRASHLGFFA